MSEPIRDAAAKLLEQLQEKVQAVKATPEMEEVLRLHRALNALEEVIQQEPTTLTEVFGLEVAAGRKAQLKPWEFTGLGPLQAAKAYLKKMGEPRSIDDIVAAIRDHGGNPGSVDHLKTALTRSTFDVVKVSDDMYGPIEAFPHIKRTGRWNKKKGSPQFVKGSASSFSEDEEGEEEEESPEQSEVADLDEFALRFKSVQTPAEDASEEEKEGKDE